MSLEFKIHQIATFKKLVNVIERITPKINLECTIQGIKIQSLDNSGESLVDMQIQSQMFKSYFCVTNRVLGLDIKSLNKLLAIVTENHVVTIKHKIGFNAINMIIENSS